MKPEAKFQAKLLKALRARPELAHAVIFKHSDIIHGGIPDFSITVMGNTSWFELKVLPNKLSKLQEHYLTKLGKRAYEVRLYPDGRIGINTYYCRDLQVAASWIVELCYQ